MSDDDGYGLRERPAKRQRVEQQAPGPSGAPQATQQEAIEHLLYVRWFGGEGQTKLNKLKLRQVDNLDELPKELIESHYPERHRLPDYFTNAAYVRFTPHVECLALPGEVVRTELRLALSYRGWEYTILKKDASSSSSSSSGAAQEQTLQIMTAEFMGSDPLMAALGVRISLIAYPVVALHKTFLEDAHERLLASPDTFKGVL